MEVCLCVCGPQACRALGCLKRTLQPLRVTLEMVVSHHVGAWDPVLVFCKSSYCSWPLSSLSGPLNETVLHRYLAHRQSSGNVC